MKTIKVKWDNVEIAFERNSPELHSFIDRETGEVVVAVDGLPEDEETRRLIAADPERYIRIEPASSREQYRWMERFVATVEEQPLRDRLLLAIDGKGAFRRFKDVLLSYPQERERWFNYRGDLLHYHINQWFESKGLEPDPPSPWGEVTLPPDPEEEDDRLLQTGQGPADMLRLQVKALVDMLPGCELHSARVFLEYLRDRGSEAFAAPRGKEDLPRRSYSRSSFADPPDDLSPEELDEEDEEQPSPQG
jgi:hypothetical protein